MLVLIEHLAVQYHIEHVRCAWQPLTCIDVANVGSKCGAGGMVEIFLFIIAAGVIAHLIGASVHEGIFVGALVCAVSLSPLSTATQRHLLHSEAGFVVLSVDVAALCAALLDLAEARSQRPHGKPALLHKSCMSCEPCAGVHVVNIHCGEVPDGQQGHQLTSWADHNRDADPTGTAIAALIPLRYQTVRSSQTPLAAMLPYAGVTH